MTEQRARELRNLQDRFIDQYQGAGDDAVVTYPGECDPVTIGDLRRNLYPRLAWSISYALTETER